MQITGNRRLPGKKICGLLFCIGILFLGAVCCGNYKPIPYNVGFSLSSGQCQGSNTSPVAGEATLTVVASVGPNITICTLRASDGMLLNHYDLDVHGDIVGHGNGLLFVNERGGDQGNSFALCAVQISNGIERWCQTRLTGMAFATVSNGMIYASSSEQTLVAALSEDDGRILWTFSTQADPALSNRPPLVVGNGAVYVSTYQSSQTGSPTPTDVGTDLASGVRHVCALGARNGRQLWCDSLDAQSNSMAVDANSLYVQTMEATVFALNLADGSVRWMSLLRVASLPYLLPHMLAAHGMVFTNEPGANSDGSDHLSALRASDGWQVWSTSYSTKIAAMAASDSALYVMLNSGDLSVLNISHGTTTWSHGSTLTSSTPVSNNTTGNIVIGQDAVYTLLSDNTYPYSNRPLLALSAKGGKTLWTDQACASATPTSFSGALTPTPGVSSSNGPCYWSGRMFQVNMNVRLFLIGN